MGLDTYAVTGIKDGGYDVVSPDGFEGISLCGGMMSGQGDGSFRGKVYANVVEEITGVSLYQEYIDPATVAKMYEAFKKFLKMDCSKTTEQRYIDVMEELTMWELEVSDVVELTKFFKVCVDKGYGLHGWW